MSRTTLPGYVLAGVVGLALFSSTAFAQSSIEGQARDSSGAVMPGVRVIAASSALIEGSRTATTNNEGRYTIVDVRPGMYSITFTMEGFTTVKAVVEVPANVTVPVDGDMKVGSVGELVNVEARVATVDVDNAAHPTVVTSTDIDAIPTARNMQSVGSYAPGVHLNIPDSGGNQQTEQTYLTGHGEPSGRDSWLLDGVLFNSTHADGQFVNYVNNSFIQESTYQTSNVDASTQGGGVYINVIPKDGGNQFHGDMFLGYVGSGFVGSNVDRNLTNRGLTGQSQVHELQDFDGSFGGRIIRDKLWFLVSMRKQLSFIQSAGSFYPNGAPGIERSYIYTPVGRLTYQMNAKNKFAVLWSRPFKWKETDVVTSAGGYSDVDPALSSHSRRPVMYYDLLAKWTGTLTPRLLLSAAFHLQKFDFDQLLQPGVQQVPFTPAWYANAQELDTVLLTRSISASGSNYSKYDRQTYYFQGVYIIGQHQIKFGVQDSPGVAQVWNISNGDATYNYANGVPVNITALNTPNESLQRVNADPGIFIMDTYRFKRLSVTAGLRWEYLSLQVDPETEAAGRFSPVRNNPLVDCGTKPGLSCFKNWAPRLGMIYDLFGNHKTALKLGIGKYNSPQTGSLLNNFDNGFSASEAVAWVNPPTTACQGTITPGCYPLGTGFGTGNIGPNPNPSFGSLPSVALDARFHREYQIQYNLGVQRELMNGVTLNFSWNHQGDYQQIRVVNSSVPASAWTPFPIVNPLNGRTVSVFNLQPAYFGLTPNFYMTNSPQSLRSNTYNGFETQVIGRLRRGIFVTAAWTIDRSVDKQCDESANPLGAGYNDPNTLLYCDWGALGIPYRSEFKFQGSVPVKWGFIANASFYSDPVYTTYATNAGGTSSPLAIFDGSVQGFKAVNWTVSPTTRYPLDCNCPNPGAVVDPGLKQGNEVIPLVAPGSVLGPRLNQLDIGIRKTFKFRERYTVLGELQIFNVLNGNTPLIESFSLGKSAAIYMPGGIGGSVQSVQNPRMLRLNMQFHF